MPDIRLRAEQSLGQQDPIQLYKLLIRETHIVPGLADAHCLQHASVPQLTLDSILVENIRYLITV